LLKKVLKEIILNKGYIIYRYRSHYLDFYDRILDMYLLKKKELYFIQIGANDGVFNDPLYNFIVTNHAKVKGISLEPIKDYYEELKNNYKKYPDIITINAAIHNTEKEMPIYRVDPERQNEFSANVKGIASFNRDHLSGYEPEVIVQEVVPCLSFSSLIQGHHIEEIDLLQIDTEGYDSEIILNIDFNLIRPKIIHFEHGLSDKIMTQEKFSNIINILHNNEYEIWLDSYDATAYQRNIFFEFL